MLKRLRGFSAATGLIALGCAAAAGHSPARATPAATWTIVALGDSVPRGTNCGCRPYPLLTADGLTGPGRAVTATNDSVGGFTTANVLGQLTSDSQVVSAVRIARVVEIEIGANDVAFSNACGTSAGCYIARIPTVSKNLAAIVSRVRAITAGRHVVVVLLDYWSVWLGGRYATARGTAYVAAAATVTAQVNAVIKSTAMKTGSAYIDLRAAFKGPDYAYDETHFLASDGDHPNASGQQRIATVTVKAIRKALHL